MLRILILMMTMISLTSCRRPTIYSERELLEFPTEDISRIIWDFTTELRHERRLILDQSYIISGPLYTTLELQFHSQDILEMGSARQLLVDVTEGLLEWVRHSEVAFKMRPYPFMADHINIYIDFQSFHNEYIDAKYIGWVVLEKGMAYYYAFDEKLRDRDYWHIRYEPYAKSKSFVDLERDAEARYHLSHPERGPDYKMGDIKRPVKEPTQ